MPLLATLWEVVWRNAHALEPPAPQRQQHDVYDEEEEEESPVHLINQGASDPAPKLSGKRRFALGAASSDKGKDGTGGNSKQWRAGGLPVLTVVVATAVGLPLLLRHARCMCCCSHTSVCDPSS